MRRPRFRKQAVQMSLFPFLAVLVCTMGVLIVLLVTMVQQARVYASHVSEERSREQQDEIVKEQEEQRLEYEDSLWRREILEQQRGQLTHDLADRRLQLGHLEEHIRQLQEEWKQLQRQAAELEALDNAQSVDVTSAKEILDSARAELEKARREFEEAKKQAAQRPRSFAIIPYEGHQGTRRRPIYVECTQDGIIVQPEGIVLRAEDFDGPLGPGNPLDAVLRTTREYLARVDDTQRNGEPYPLLVVRPDGAVAYSFARAAMKSWDDEFGYELVEADIELKYPTPDPQLREELRRAVKDARQRQSLLAAAMPSRYRSGATAGLVASPTHGGFVAVGSGGGLGRGSDDRGDGRGAARRRRTTGGGNSRFGSPPASIGSQRGTGNASHSTGAGTGRTGNESYPTGTGSGRAGNESFPTGAGSGRGGNESYPTGAGTGRGGNESYPTGAGNAAGHSTGAGMGRAGTANHSTGTGTEGQATGAEQESQAAGTGGGQAWSLASARGSNWGLPKATATATGITRPIQVACLRDQLVILPERGDEHPARIIPIPGDSIDAIDSFVSAIWEHMEQWGIAVAGGYWKPVLHVDVGSGAEARFRELVVLLEDSGIDLKRKTR